MADTDRDAINASMGGSQDLRADDYQSAMGGWQPAYPVNALLSRITNQPLTSRIDGTVILARAA